MKFLIDMNLSPLWISFLAERALQRCTGQQWDNHRRLTLRSSISPRPTTRSFSRTISISVCCWSRYGQAGPVSFKSAPRKFYRPRLAISWSGQSKPLNQTSKPALSLPWTPFVTAFGYCLSEGIEGLPQSSRTASLQFASRLPPMQRGCSRRSARPTALLENRRISSPDPCGQEPIASRISGRVGNFDLALRRSILRGTLDVVDDQRLNRSPYRFQSEAELLRNRSEKAGLGGIVGGPS